MSARVWVPAGEIICIAGVRCIRFIPMAISGLLFRLVQGDWAARACVYVY